MTENGYKTKQKTLIFECLNENTDRALTVDEIVDYLKNKGSAVGKTTVYRYVDSLMKTGEVRRFTDDKTKSATYQYIEHHESCSKHIHLKCTECGKLIHLRCDFVNSVCLHIFEHHSFRVDNEKTAILGLCEECIRRKGTDNGAC